MVRDRRGCGPTPGLESYGLCAPPQPIRSSPGVSGCQAAYFAASVLGPLNPTRPDFMARSVTVRAAMGNLFRLNEFGGDPLWLLDTQQGPGADGLRASRAGTRLGTRPSTSIWDPTAPHPLGIRVRTE